MPFSLDNTDIDQSNKIGKLPALFLLFLGKLNKSMSYGKQHTPSFTYQVPTDSTPDVEVWTLGTPVNVFLLIHEYLLESRKLN